MKVLGVRYSDGELHIRCDLRDGMHAAAQIEVDKDYDIVPHVEKRSLNANAYAWALIHKIAAALRLSPIDVYRNAIDNTGVIASIVCIRDIAAPKFIQSWEGDHIGRQCKNLGSSHPGFTDIMCIYGSSDFSKAEMARFIDGLVQDAQALGIETMQEEKLNSLLQSWK